MEPWSDLAVIGRAEWLVPRGIKLLVGFDFGRGLGEAVLGSQ